MNNTHSFPLHSSSVTQTLMFYSLCKEEATILFSYSSAYRPLRALHPETVDISKRFLTGTPALPHMSSVHQLPGDGCKNLKKCSGIMISSPLNKCILG